MKRNRDRIICNRKTGNTGTRNGRADLVGKAVCFTVLCIMTGLMLTGCGTTGRKYTREELDSLARLELYEAESDTLLKTIEDEEILYQYVQAVKATDSYDWDWDDTWEEEEKNLKETAETPENAETMENAGATYYLVVYRYPAAKFGNKEPKKNYTTTLYRDMNIAKVMVAQESIKITLPEEWLTFYYEMSEAEMDFYESLVSQE